MEAPRREPPINLDEDGVLNAALESVETLRETTLLSVYREIPKGAVERHVAPDAGEPTNASSSVLDASADGGFLNPIKRRPEVVAEIVATTNHVKLQREVGEPVPVTQLREPKASGHRVELQDLSWAQFVVAELLGQSAKHWGSSADAVSTLDDAALDGLDITDVSDRDSLKGRTDNDSVGADETVDPGEQLEGATAVIAVHDQDLWAELRGRLIVWER